MRCLLLLIILKSNFLFSNCEDTTHFYDMHWEEINDCLESEKRVIDVSAIKIKKFTRTLVGVTGVVDIAEDITKGFMAEISVLKRTITNSWVPVDIPYVTSLRHDGCTLMEANNIYITAILKSAQIENRCPIKEGFYTMLNDSMVINLPKYVMPNCYKCMLKLFDTEDNTIMCGNAVIKVVPTGEGPYPKCV